MKRVFIALLFVFLWYGCSTQKNSWLSRNYHSVSAKYNGFFNARESYLAGLNRLSAEHHDNFDQVLSIFRYGNAAQAQAIAGNMEVAYQKASLVIRRHSMFIRGVEHNRWIDDAYFLIARSHYFRGDYNRSNLTFQYIIRLYETDVAYQSKVWLAKIGNQTGRFDQARQMLEMVQRDYDQGLLNAEGRRLFYLTYTDHFARQQKFAEAIPHLQRGIKATRNNREQTRLTFILGQFYHNTGNFASAQNTYASVLKMNPTFDMAFQARISMAMAFDPSTGNSAFIRSELNRMLRDNNNELYQDRIYYALAQLAMRENKPEEAIEHYQKSTRASTTGGLQKGLSFLRIGEIFFARPDYLKASINYDSAMTFLPQHYFGIEQIAERRSNLSELASNLRVVEREDSLLRLAAMSPAERNSIVDKIIAELRMEEQRQRELESDQMQTMVAMEQQRRQGEAQDASWYFYNPSAISFGRTEFISRFGQRPLADLWRIGNKQTIAIGIDSPNEDISPENNSQTSDNFDRNFYLQNIPSNPEQLQEANNRIALALYNAGIIFKDRFNDPLAAISSFETLVTRYPDNENILRTFYFLMSIYRGIGNIAKADVYKTRIINEFPESDFARILGDPEYLRNLRERENFANHLYTQTYQAFKAGNYSQVVANWQTSSTLDLEKNLQSQFFYLRALTHGRTGKPNEFRQDLEFIIKNFEGTIVHQPASNLLASLGAHSLLLPEHDQSTPSNQLQQVFTSIYSHNPDVVHFFACVIDTRQVEARELRNFISAFNREHYPDTRLTLSNIFLDDQRQIVTITNFSNQNAGMEYFRRIMATQGMQSFPAGALSAFIISVDNYPIFYQEKNVDEYLTFFRAMYTR